MLNQAKKFILILFLLHLSFCEADPRKNSILNKKRVIEAYCDGYTYTEAKVYGDIQRGWNKIYRNHDTDDKSDYGTFPDKFIKKKPFGPIYHFETLGMYDYGPTNIKNLPMDYKQDVVIFTPDGTLVDVIYKRVKPGNRKYKTTFTDCDLTFES